MSKNIITTLEEKDIGRTVWYAPSHALDDVSQWEKGRIKSFDNERQIAWVVYDGGNDSKIDHYDRYTAASTQYNDLRSKPEL